MSSFHTDDIEAEKAWVGAVGEDFLEMLPKGFALRPRPFRSKTWQRRAREFLQKPYLGLIEPKAATRGIPGLTIQETAKECFFNFVQFLIRWPWVPDLQ